MKSKIALIGCGGRSELAVEFHRPDLGAELVAAADPNQTAGAKFFRKLENQRGGKPHLYADYREMLEKEHPDAVLILSPDFLHKEQSDYCLQNHCSIYLEKPMALQVADCDSIIRLARRNHQKLMVGHNMRYMRFTRKIHDLIASGAIGEVRAIWCRHFVNYGGYAYFTRWMCEEDKVNSLLLQKGAHDIDIIHWFGGAESVLAVGMGNLSVFNRCHRRKPGEPRPSDDIPPWPPLEKQNLNPVINVNDHNMLMLTLANGVQATLLECFYTPDSCRNYTVIGTAGRIENYGDCHDNPTVEVWNTRHLDKVFNMKGDLSFDVTPTPGSHGGADPLIAEDFIRYLHGEKEPDIPISYARAAIAAGCAGAESMRRGSVPIKVEPLPEDLRS
ncbi:MAG: Gfo/Idh/MocA family oxidoreductase [Lentisphaerae bacterium]|nr:Gfo/Idh/MocA family oxidoreductase [Lentisphaerota bacterium]